MCELAREDPPRTDAAFVRLEGAGGDGGVECYWRLPDGDEHGWQSKYWMAVRDVSKAQLDKSVKAALNVHPNLTSYTIAIPVDPTGPTARKGLSLLEKIEGKDGWLAGWQALARARGKDVAFHIEWRESLRSRLVSIDTSGFRTRYWFDADLLDSDWWGHRLEDAYNGTRPRYIPGLVVKVPAGDAMKALCQDSGWDDELLVHSAEITDSQAQLRRVESEVPTADLTSITTVCSEVVVAIEAFRSNPNAAQHELLETAIQRVRETAAAQLGWEIADMGERHGDGWDTASWRQFQAEYQVSFPAAAVDALRKLLERLDALASLTSGPHLRVAFEQVLLLTGVAGTGKTFVGYDVIANRLSAGSPSLFLHGRVFSTNDPLLDLRDRLKLPADLSGDDVLGLLDQAGRSTGAPVLMFIDALNETVPRRTWHDHLDQFVGSFTRHENLRLVLSVRTPYLNQVVPDGLRLSTLDHRGFEGLEFEALADYADYYNLKAPTTPPLQGEFTNPLYLRLLCETLQEGGHLSLEDAGLGIRELSRLLLERKNRTISQSVGAAEADRIVHRGMAAIAEAVGRRGAATLPRTEAYSAIADIWPDRQVDRSLIEALIGEGLLSEDRVPINGEDTDVVSVAFERLGHHLVMSQQMKGIKSAEQLSDALKSGSLRELLQRDQVPDIGMLEALSVIVADTLGAELDRQPELGEEAEVLAASITGLTWRDASTVTSGTEALVIAALGRPETATETMDMLFRLSAKPAHPLNAEWLHDLFAQTTMAQRDHFLVPWLHESYDQSTAVDRLINWGRSRDLTEVTAESSRLWIIALLWCTCSTDRRVRDGATIAATRLLSRRPALAAEILRRFLPVDDDWVQERALAATYASLLLSGTPDDWRASAGVVLDLMFAGLPPDNAALRDAGRSILEGALDRGLLPDSGSPDRFRPPFGSPWPIEWPTTEDVATYGDESQYPKLARSCTSDDFFIYQLTDLMEDLDGIDVAAAARRVLHDVVDLGYDPALHAPFDRYVLGKFGRGRGKPGWIERIGKKYQWIALARLTGIVSDHAAKEANSWDPPPSPEPGPLAERLRQIDPTCCEPTDFHDEPRPWVPSYNWAAVESTDDSSWVQKDRFPDIDLCAASYLGREHVVLTGSYAWEQGERSDGRERRVWMQLTPYLTRTTDLKTHLDSLIGKDLAGHHLARTPMISSGYVGEYPSAFIVRADLARIDHEESTRQPPWWPATLDLLGEYEYEYASVDSSTISLDAPSPLMFGASGRALQWDGASGWNDVSGLPVAHARRRSGRFNELTIDQSWLDQWLITEGLSLIWIEISGNDVLTGFSSDHPGRMMRTRIRYRDGNGLAQLSPVYDRGPSSARRSPRTSKGPAAPKPD